jgi:PAS domain S-box-containing protein
MLTETITILLVEDNSRDARLVQEMLQDVEAFEFQLIHVSRLADALNCLTAKTWIASEPQRLVSNCKATPEELAEQSPNSEARRNLTLLPLCEGYGAPRAKQEAIANAGLGDRKTLANLRAPCRFPLKALGDRKRASVPAQIKSFSVILLDLSLPDAQGLDTVTQVLLASPDTPIVVMSGLSDEAIALQALQKGAQDYLVKGDTSGQLLVRSLRYAIERQRMQGRLQQAQQELRLQAQREALVNHIMMALNSEGDPRKVLDEIVQQIAAPMNCDCCMVVRAMPEVDSICVEAEYWPNSGEGVKHQGQIPVTTDWKQVREVLKQNQAVAITAEEGAHRQRKSRLPLHPFSPASSNPLSPVFQSVPPEQRPVAMLLAPIFVREEYYGHLLVGYLQHRQPFSAGEIHLLQQLAGQTALALSNAHRLEQLEQLAQERTQQLAREKTLLEVIVNSIQEGICVMQPDGQVVLTNPANWQILGTESEETSEPLCKLLDKLQIQEPDGSVPTKEELPSSRTLRGEVVTDYELVVGCPNGQQKWISVNGVTVCDPVGQVQLAINTTRDITERKRTEEALRESETKFRTLYESTSAAVILLDENEIFDANSAALQMFGCTQREQLCGKEGEPGSRGASKRGRVFLPTVGQTDNSISCSPCHPLGFSPPMQPNGQESMRLAQEYIATAISEGSCRFDWIYRRQNGEDFPAEVTLTRIELGNRKVLQAVIYDIEERKATEAQLLGAKEAAEAGSRAKSEFLATMSHELRTPLNAVLGLSQLMRQEIFGTLNDKQKEYVACIQSSGEHLLALINDILDLSKVEAGKEQLIFVPLEIQELCDYCLAMVREQAYERGLKLTLSIDPEARICIADERRCKQMLLNLLSNAIKFTPVGEVTLIVDRLPKGISFTVEDTGIGIASEKLPLLFEPFRQLDSGLNRKFPGTGLGLALTRSLARLHGGDVKVKSTLGHGSQFTLYLPDLPSEELLVPSSPQELGESEHESFPPGAKGHILLVENDERSAMLLKDYLQVIGHRVKHVTNGTDFLDLVRSFKPNLILMDVDLRGDCTGFDLLAALRREPDTKNLKVVMVTAMAMAGDRERCLEAGANDYLSKPIGIAQLEAILMRYLT